MHAGGGACTPADHGGQGEAAPARGARWRERRPPRAPGCGGAPQAACSAAGAYAALLASAGAGGGQGQEAGGGAWALPGPPPGAPGAKGGEAASGGGGERGRRRARAVAAGGAALRAESNVGYRMLERMGWKAGQGLGTDKSGPTEAVGAVVKADRGGIGRLHADDREVGKEPPERTGTTRAAAAGATADAAANTDEAKLARQSMKERRERERRIGRALAAEWDDDGEASVEALLRGVAPPPKRQRARGNPLDSMWQ